MSANNELYKEKRFGDQRQRLSEIMVMKEMPKVRETHILERGHYENRGDLVNRATPEVLPPSQRRLLVTAWTVMVNLG